MANQLFPIFLVPDKLSFLIVGGGSAGSEKLRFLLKSSSVANVRIVSPNVSNEIEQLSEIHSNAEVALREFKKEDLTGIDVVIIATNNTKLNSSIRSVAKARGLLVNVADTPSLCDFYLGSIVTKGDLKIAISTNGKSPTLAKRMRQFFEQELPDEMDALVSNLNGFRNTLRGDFKKKVSELNRVTKSLLLKDQGL